MLPLVSIRNNVVVREGRQQEEKRGGGDGVLGQCRRLSICTCSKDAVHFPWHQDAVITKHLDERAAGKKHFFHTFLVLSYKFFCCTFLKNLSWLSPLPQH